VGRSSVPFTAPKPIAPAPADLRGARVLVVDDERSWRVILETYPVFPSGTDDPDVVGYMSKAVDRADLYALLPPAIRRSRERRDENGGA